MELEWLWGLHSHSLRNTADPSRDGNRDGVLHGQTGALRCNAPLHHHPIGPKQGQSRIDAPVWGNSSGKLKCSGPCCAATNPYTHRQFQKAFFGLVTLGGRHRVSIRSVISKLSRGNRECGLERATELDTAGNKAEAE